jgi:anti-sigma regulatory factor (Ser/Thr protein kinase)
VLDVARTTDLGGIEVDDLACAVSEAVTNGIRHDRSRLWLAHQMSLHDAQQDQRWLHHPFHRRVLDLTS